MLHWIRHCEVMVDCLLRLLQQENDCNGRKKKKKHDYDGTSHAAVGELGLRIVLSDDEVEDRNDGCDDCVLENYCTVVGIAQEAK